jgi:hypothetical protein
MGLKRTCLLQESTLYWVNKDLSVTRNHFILSRYGFVFYKKTLCMALIRTCLLQDSTLYWVNKHLSVTRKHLILGQ